MKVYIGITRDEKYDWDLNIGAYGSLKSLKLDYHQNYIEVDLPDNSKTLCNNPKCIGKIKIT